MPHVDDTCAIGADSAAWLHFHATAYFEALFLAERPFARALLGQAACTILSAAFVVWNSVVPSGKGVVKGSNSSLFNAA